MKLNVKINKIKSIKELEIDLPTAKGLYAITGQNGSGKSTLVTCASTVFFHISMNDYFGDTPDDSSIKFELGTATRSWTKNNNKWLKESHGDMGIKGFYEGSIIFGNRFRNTSLSLLKGLDTINDDILEKAPEFIRENLGVILHNNRNFYDSLLKVNSSKLGSEYNFTGDVYFYLKNGKRVSQLHMSTGENLLISVLHSINKRNHERASLLKLCMLFLDEIELALHPSSLKRLVVFLKEMSQQYIMLFIFRLIQ